MEPKFMSSTDSDEKRTMYSKNNSSIITKGNDTDKIIEKFFASVLHKVERLFMIMFPKYIYLQ